MRQICKAYGQIDTLNFDVPDGVWASMNETSEDSDRPTTRLGLIWRLAARAVSGTILLGVVSSGLWMWWQARSRMDRPNDTQHPYARP